MLRRLEGANDPGIFISAAARSDLTAAAEALSEYTDPGRLLEGAVYPRVDALRRASKHVAVAVAEQALSDGVARRDVGADVSAAVLNAMWEPKYLPIRRP